MGSYTTLESTHTLNDGKQLYTKTWRPSDGKVRAYLIFIHGHSDHCNAYTGFFESLVSRNIEIRGFDTRGQGRSVSSRWERGATGPTGQLLQDMTSIVQSVITSRADPSAPLFLMGHSLGGVQVLTYAAKGPFATLQHIRGYLTQGAYIGLVPHRKPSPALLFIGKYLAYSLPWWQVRIKAEVDVLSRDPVAKKRIADDALMHETGTLGGIWSMLQQGADFESGRVKIPADAGEGGKVRLWISHGDEDMICDLDATKRMYDQIGPEIEDKELKVYPGGYHRLHEDINPEGYIDDVANWILTRSGPLPTPLPTTSTEPKVALQPAVTEAKALVDAV